MVEPMAKWMHVECEINVDFVYNGCFDDFVRGREGADIWDQCNGDLHFLGRNYTKSEMALILLCANRYDLLTACFDVGHFLPSKYSSHFGMIFHGDWVTYDSTPNNTDLAFTRITKCRGIDAADYGAGVDVRPCRGVEGHLRRNNVKFFTGKRRKSRVYNSILSRIRNDAVHVLANGDDVMAALKKYSEMKHSKRQIRLRSFKGLCDKGLLTGYFTEVIQGKLKLFEKAKPGKPPRYIGDYSTPGSLLGGYLCDVLKHCFGERNVGNVIFSYVGSAEPEEMDRIGKMLRDDPRDQCYFFSDDMLMKIGGKYYEVDISSCDMSNTWAVFAKTLSLVAGFATWENLLRRVIRQCALPVYHKNPRNKSQKLKFRPIDPIEFSGTTLTTLLNNLASLAICVMSILNGAQSKEDIAASAFACGYKVTCHERSSLEECQFLKHSWDTNDMGEPKSFLNLGAMLRSFGQADRELPGRGDLRVRAYDWCSAVVRGYKHSGNHVVLQAISRVYHGEKEVKFTEEEKKHFYPGTNPARRGWISTRALCKRYKVPECEFDCLVEQILSTDPWSGKCTYICSDLLERIYEVDYGLKPARKLSRLH